MKKGGADVKRIVKIVPVAVLLISLLLGCGNSSKRNNAFVGKWKTDSDIADFTLDFKKDGTVEEDGVVFGLSYGKWETGEKDIRYQDQDLHFYTLEITYDDGSSVEYLFFNDLKKSDKELETFTYDGEILYSEFTLIRE